jgi:hypothetical protein
VGENKREFLIMADMQAFIKEIATYDYGVVAFNTYKQGGVPMCYIMIAMRGDSGRFIKRECKYEHLNETLDFLLIELKGGMWKG